MVIRLGVARRVRFVDVVPSPCVFRIGRNLDEEVADAVRAFGDLERRLLESGFARSDRAPRTGVIPNVPVPVVPGGLIPNPNEVAEVVADYSRWLESNELPLTHEPEMTKVMVSELQQRLVDTGMKILGPFGQLKEGSKTAPLKGRMEWCFLHSFLTTIGGGTSEIGRNIIAQRGLNLPR